MSFHKSMNRVILFLIVINMLIVSVYSLGIYPARKAFDYSDRVSGSIKVINNQHKPLKLVVYASGELESAFNFEKTVFFLNSSQNSVVIPYTINAQDLSPGRHKTDVVVLQLPSQLAEGNTIITDSGTLIMKKNSEELMSATTAVLSSVYLDVPYPGKFIDSKLYVDNSNGLGFTVSVFSRGSERINNVYANILIKGPTNKEIANIKTNTLSLDPGADGKLTASYNQPLESGVYYAEAIIHFDGNEIVKRETFMVNNMNINILDLSIDRFKLGQIAKIDVSVESDWNSVIKDVYADFNLIDSSGQVVDSLKTVSVDVHPHEKTVLSGFWDTSGVSVGTYDIGIVLHYNNKESNKLFKAVIGLDKISLTDYSAGNVVKVDSSSNSVIPLLIVAVVVLIVINLGWFFYFKKHKR